ncbi:hypothetical protein [Methanosarcina sp.]|jgi:hypothetical protein|uniref:hypothetical protein n=1 Tax=Methanosarcina sp. TaxID=2213 RepID=UPI002BA20A21|nr:hypothetical protein [Methanosarcina sp.]HOW15603.1 hypothetical protein [Methanosarcina sp.]
MKLDGTITLFAVFLGLATLSGYLVLADDNKAKTPENTGNQFDKIASDREMFKNFSKHSEENIVKKIEIQNFSFESQEYWDGFETVTINVEEFENAAAKGNVSLRLLEKNFEIQITEISRLNGGKSYRYSGYVKGIPQSKATFYVCGELFSGSIEFEDLMYNIAVTSEIKDRETVYVVFEVDWKKNRERLKYLLNPMACLTFGQETKYDILLGSAPLINCISIYNPSEHPVLSWTESA